MGTHVTGRCGGLQPQPFASDRDSVAQTAGAKPGVTALFVAEGDQRVHAHSRLRGQVPGQGCGGRQRERQPLSGLLAAWPETAIAGLPRPARGSDQNEWPKDHYRNSPPVEPLATHHHRTGHDRR